MEEREGRWEGDVVLSLADTFRPAEALDDKMKKAGWGTMNSEAWAKGYVGGRFKFNLDDLKRAFEDGHRCAEEKHLAKTNRLVKALKAVGKAVRRSEIERKKSEKDLKDLLVAVEKEFECCDSHASSDALRGCGCAKGLIRKKFDEIRERRNASSTGSI